MFALNLIATTLLFVFSSNADASDFLFQPALVDTVPNKVFAPRGFDNNDNAQLVLDGDLKNTCYKLGPAKIRIDQKEHKIYVRQQLFYYPGAWCADVGVPYVQPVDLGILKSGQYTVMIEHDSDAPQAVASLPIASSSSLSPDDFLYAPLSSAHIEKRAHDFEGRSDFSNDLVLKGVFRNSCMRFKKIMVTKSSNDVIEVLPIVEMSKEAICAQTLEDFEVTTSLKNFASGRYLIHVRSLNGQSFNQVVDL